MNKTRANIQAVNASMYKYPYQNLSLMDMEGEVWLPAPGLEGYVTVSNLGRIKRLARVDYRLNGQTQTLPEKIMIQKIKIRKTKSGISDFISPVFSVMIQRNRKLFTVSRMVYSAFVVRLDPAKKNKQLILHKDMDGLNNRVENLYLATNKELSDRNFKLGIIPELDEETMASYLKPVSQYSLSGVFLYSYPSIKEAERQTGISEVCIIRVAKNKQSHAGGFIWLYGKSTEKLSDQDLDKVSTMIKIPINQYDSNNQLIGTFKNSRCVAKQMQFTDSECYRLGKLLRMGQGIAEFKGYIWKYATL